MANAVDLKGKLAFLVVTGASRGIGSRMAIETSREFAAGSVVVLLARSAKGLEATKDEILKLNSELKVVTRSLDLTKPTVEDLKDLYDEKVDFELVMMIHNVGTVGDVGKWSTDIEDYVELQNYFSTNVYGPIILNNYFLKQAPASCKKFIINITSLAAISPFKSFGFYGPGKAAREMFFRVLALEFPDILVLNYSPGPVDTEMTVDAQKNAIASETSTMFKEARESGTILTTEQTTKKFLEVVAKGNYKSGDHVDFYDEI